MLKLVDLATVGAGEHRSGWPYCLEALKPLFSEDAPVLFDDFCERTFLYDNKWHGEVVHDVPWVGVLHHPPDMPNWYLRQLHLQRLHENERWQESLSHLRLLISMGGNLTEWCQQIWPHIPVVTVRHPTGLPQMYWSPERFFANRQKRLVQVGWFLRNTYGIYQANAPRWLRKSHLCQKLRWVEHAHWLCETTYKELHPSRGEPGDVERLPQLNDTSYDILLSESVVFMEVISAVANNTVVECIIRNTPICINRHPGPEYYLGKDYPLFYDHFSQLETLLTVERIVEAHRYLAQMDKWWIHGNMFKEQVHEACSRHVPEYNDTAVTANDPVAYSI